MSYILCAQNQTGSWIYIKNPIQLNYKLQETRARQLTKLPGIKIVEITTTTGQLIKSFVPKN
jgi:hypothetical protein